MRRVWLRRSLGVLAVAALGGGLWLWGNEPGSEDAPVPRPQLWESGSSACVLHEGTFSSQCKRGDWLLVDVTDARQWCDFTKPMTVMAHSVRCQYHGAPRRPRPPTPPDGTPSAVAAPDADGAACQALPTREDELQCEIERVRRLRN